MKNDKRIEKVSPEAISDAELGIARGGNLKARAGKAALNGAKTVGKWFGAGAVGAAGKEAYDRARGNK